MTTFKLVGFIGDMVSMENYVSVTQPILKHGYADYYVRSSSWTTADMNLVTESEESYISRLDENSDVTIAEGEEVWLIGRDIMVSLNKAASVIPSLNGAVEFIDSWNGYQSYRISTGTFDELNKFFAPIKQALAEEIHKELLDFDNHNFDSLHNMVKLADKLPCEEKTMEDFLRFAAFYKKADMDENYNYMFTRTWAALSSPNFKNDAESEKRFDALVEDYLNSKNN
jgi:hypothetical protein